MKLWQIFGILLEAAALCCFGICIFRKEHPKLLLPIGLLFNSLALLLFVLCG